MSSAGNSKETPNTKIYSNLESASCKFYRDNSERTANEESTRGTNTANLQKYEFFKDKKAYCGHEIDKDGLHNQITKLMQ